VRKGSALAETIGLEGRLLAPVVNGQEATWDTALDHVAQGFGRIVREHRPDSVAFYVSGQILTEDYYVINKLAKGFIGTANIDTNSRLCMASSVAGHKRAFGSDTVPGCYEDLETADLLVLVGSNAAWCHPILYQRMVAAKANNPACRIVVIDPRRTATCDGADLHLPLRSGSDSVLFNGLLAHLASRDAIDSAFVDGSTTGVEAALRQVAGQTVAQTAEICGLAEGAVALLFDWFAKTERVVTLYSQGVNQSSSGVDKVNAIINCHLLTGRIGRPGMGPFSLTGQPNAMGGREVGGLANQLAAHMEIETRNTATSSSASGSRQSSRTSRASRPSTCSTRSPINASRRSGSCPPIRWSACRMPIACAARSMHASSSSSPIACGIPTPRVMPTYCCLR
jgi:assimilatory nitrate reductase catalytic subunit